MIEIVQIAALLDASQQIDLRPAWPGSIHERRLIKRLAEALAEATPAFIETEQQLDELPPLAVVLDAHGDVFQLRGGLWCAYETIPFASHRLAKYGPFTVIYNPNRKAEQ